MAVTSLASVRSPTKSPFDIALAGVRRAEALLDATQGPIAGRHYRAAVERLMVQPAPSVAALAEKIAACDPFDLDHHHAILADARRLAGR